MSISHSEILENIENVKYLGKHKTIKNHIFIYQNKTDVYTLFLNSDVLRVYESTLRELISQTDNHKIMNGLIEKLFSIAHNKTIILDDSVSPSLIRRELKAIKLSIERRNKIINL